MSGSAEILQEYLVKLGYKTDLISARRFDEQLSGTGKKIAAVGRGTASVIATVAAASAAFAYSMRKTYFTADLASSSIKKMNSIGFAAKQVGIDSETAQGAVTALARAMRTNPGQKAYVESLIGGSIAGRDMADVLNDLVKATSKYDQFVGSQMVAPFMDADTYALWLKHGDEMAKQMAKADKMFDQSGINQEKLGREVLKVATAYDTLAERAELAAKRILAATQKPTIAVMDFMGDNVEFWARQFEQGLHIEEGSVLDSLLGRDKARERAKGREVSGKIPQRALRQSLPPLKGGVDLLTPAEKERARVAMGLPAADGHQAMAAQMAAKYGLDPVIFARQIQTESNWNPRAVSPKGAMGLGQLMPGTARAFGVTDPFDPAQNLEAAAKFQAQLLAKYGNQADALSAYNRGEPNFDAWIKNGRRPGDEPPETANYRAKILGDGYRLGGGKSVPTSVTMQTTIQVNGANDPGATAREVAGIQGNVAKDVLRNTRGLEN